MKRLALIFIAVLLAATLGLAGCAKMPGNTASSNDQPASPTGNAVAPSNLPAETQAEAQPPQSLPFAASKPAEKASAAAASQQKRSLVPNSETKPSALVPANLVIPAGTSISIRLQSGVSSASAVAGEHFDAVLDNPLVVEGHTVAPQGAPVVGRVVQAKRSGRLHSSGYLRVTLASVEINGKAVPVQSSSIFVKGANHNRRNLALIGGGSGAGALIGGLAGGGKGALIGGLVGAGAGTTGAYATGKKDVGFGPERRLTFRLLQPVSAQG